MLTNKYTNIVKPRGVTKKPVSIFLVIFLLLIDLLLCLKQDSLRLDKKINKTQSIVHVNKPPKLNRIFIRNMRPVRNFINAAKNATKSQLSPGGSTSYNTPKISTQQTPPPVLPETQQTRGMTSIIGKFKVGSKHNKSAQSPHGVPHNVMVDENVKLNPKASQAPAILTSDIDAPKKDPRVTSLSKLADRLYNGKPGPQYLAIHDRGERYTNADVPDFIEQRMANSEEDGEFQQIQQNLNTPVYQEENLDITRRLISGENVLNQPNVVSQNDENKSTSLNNSNSSITQVNNEIKNNSVNHNKNEES